MNKVYIVNTIETCDSGDNFTIENVFSKFIDAAKRSLELSYKYNTEEYPKKNKDKLKEEYDKLILIFDSKQSMTKKEFEKIIINFDNLLDDFLTIKKEYDTISELPQFRSYVSCFTVDNTNDNERVSNDHL